MLLQREQYLHRIDGLDEVVGYLGADGLVHDVLLFVLRHHDDGSLGLYVLDALERLKSCQTGHHLVEQHEVERLLLTLLDGVHAIAGHDDVVAFLFQQ